MRVGIISILLLLFASITVAQSITIQFSGTPSYVNVSKANLKYNKDFAVSFTYDDGLSSPIENCMAFQNGGVAKDNTYYPGLFFTDGCGVDIPFTSGLAYFSRGGGPWFADLHNGSLSNYFSWNQLIDAYNNGWDAINHQYSNGAPGYYEVKQNELYTWQITDSLGTPIKLTHFVIPAGQSGWINDAFSAGVKSIHNEATPLDGYNLNIGAYHWTGGGVLGFRLDTVTTVNRFLLTRENRNSGDPYPAITNYVDQIATKSVGGQKFWLSEFTHGVEVGGTGGGMDFGVFKQYLSHIEQNYGKSGSDRVLYSSVQEVWEYMHTKLKTNVTTNLVGNQLTIDFDTSSCDQDLRRYHLTLLIDSDKDFTITGSSGIDEYTYKGNSGDKMINVFINDSPHHSGHTTGVNNQSASFEVRELKDGIIVLHDESEKLHVKIFDQLGREIYSENTLTNNKLTIPFNNRLVIYQIIDDKGNTIKSGKLKLLL